MGFLLCSDVFSTTLYYVAQNMNYLVAGTGNKCEATVGYTTKWGDNASDFNPIGEFTVEEVLQIGKYLGVPEKIINKAPNDGLGGKTDEVFLSFRLGTFIFLHTLF